MKSISITELPFSEVDFDLFDIFLACWKQQREFSLYKNNPRPHSALFFVCSEIEVSFLSKNTQTVIAKKGDIVFIPKGSDYHVRAVGETENKIDSYTINFRLSDKNGEELALSDHIAVLTNRLDNLLTIHLDKLFDAFYGVDHANVHQKRNLIKIKGEFFLLLDLIAESTNLCNDSSYPIRKGITAFCKEWNLNEKIEKYAKLCDVNITYFYRFFRKWSGRSPIEYRNMLRLANAESMLRCTDMKIQTISETVGFDDPFYFCRLFSQKFGISPQKYRKRIQNKGG